MKDIESFRKRIREIDGVQFINQFNDICSELEKKHSILTFGFIIFDESNPEIRKVLRDQDYWEALDKASGERMMIFAVSDERKKEEVESDDRMYLMTSFNAPSRSKTKSYSKIMKELFEDESSLVYPSVLFFQVQNGLISDYRLVPLNRGDTWNSMVEVQKLFASITDVLKNITLENFGNRREIFELVRNELQRQKYTIYILNGTKRLSDFIGIVRNLLFL